MSHSLVIRGLFVWTWITLGINGVGWYGLWRTYGVSPEREKSGEQDHLCRSKAETIITPVIRLEFAYYLFLVFYQFLGERPLSSFWVVFLFVYHLLGLLGHEGHRGWGQHLGESSESQKKRGILLATIAALDAIEVYVLIAISREFYLLSRL